MTEDEKEFEEILQHRFPYCGSRYKENARKWFLEGRRTLREKIRSDPSIGKLIAEPEWPESPDY